MDTPDEARRRQKVAEINADPGSRETLESTHGQVWDTQQLGDDFEVVRFSAPYVAVRRKSDNRIGTLTFQHWPRFYYAFQPTPAR